MEDVRTIFTGGKKYGPRGSYFGNTGSITVAADKAAECADNYFRAALPAWLSAVSLHDSNGRRLWFYDGASGRITGRTCWLDCKAAARYGWTAAARPSWAAK